MKSTDDPVYRHPLFWFGLLIKILLLAALIPQAVSLWYAPFLDHGLQAGFDGIGNPWAVHLASHGDARAFPYGYGMWLCLLPLSSLFILLGQDPSLGYVASLLVADIALLWVLRRLLKVSARTLLSLYWLSPIVMFATYWLGLNDLVPVVFLCAAILGLRALLPRAAAIAGVCMGVAISAKLSMILAVPFLFFYLWRHPARQALWQPFAAGLLSASAVLQLPFWCSPAARHMLLENPELDKIYELSIHLGKGIDLYVLPIAYLLTVFMAWRLRRMHFDFLLAFLGITFLLVLLLTPAAPGWFVWALPFLVVYQVFSGKRSAWLVIGFALLYVVTSFFSMPLPEMRVLPSTLNALLLPLHSWFPSRAMNLIHSALLAFGLALIWRLWKEAVQQHPGFRLDKHPLVIGISGDSGAGKDSLADALEDLFGSHSVAKLSGDDYHFWDRHKPMWQVMTHLNPRANDLAQFGTDLATLIAGKSILTRHYDHSVGRKGKPYRAHSNDIIIASGLHALYLPFLRNRYDLSIYLDIDEQLRRFFKVRRDVHQRGHSLQKVLDSMQRRVVDAQHFIHPQAEHADLVLSLQPVQPRLLDNAAYTGEIRLKLVVRAQHSSVEEALVRVLVGYCGLHVDLQLSGDQARVLMTIEGECAAADLAIAARQLLPQCSELLDIAPRWCDGIAGIMQLVVISHVHQALQRRHL